MRNIDCSKHDIILDSTIIWDAAKALYQFRKVLLVNNPKLTNDEARVLENEFYKSEKLFVELEEKGFPTSEVQGLVEKIVDYRDKFRPVTFIANTVEKAKDAIEVVLNVVHQLPELNGFIIEKTEKDIQKDIQKDIEEFNKYADKLNLKNDELCYHLCYQVGVANGEDGSKEVKPNDEIQ